MNKHYSPHCAENILIKYINNKSITTYFYMESKIVTVDGTAKCTLSIPQLCVYVFKNTCQLCESTV